MAWVPTNSAAWLDVGEFTTIEVDTLSFEEARVALAELSLYIENVQLPLRAVERIARQDMEERFDSETAPDGVKWFALDPRYAKRKVAKVGFEHPILTYSGELRRKATSKEAFTVTVDSIFYNTSELPEYWRVHQEGSETFGAHFHASANPEAGSPTAEGVQNIPPRPFIGLSVDAEEEIFTLFNIWFGEGIDLATKKFVISSAGTLHARTPQGRIGQRIRI